jgi:general nucleoside transport system permease protein
MWEIISKLFPYAIAFTIPLLITALGGLYSERSGVVNIGLEGLMVVGSFMGALVIKMLDGVIPGMPVLSLWLGLLAAVIAGALFSLLHAVASINLNANQVISGTAINMIAGALMVFLARKITGSGNIDIISLPRGDVPFLSTIPVIGKLLFTQSYATTWVVLLILLISWFLLFKTPFGLRLRACGEHPQAAEAAGINVAKMRYIGVLTSGACAGLGGAVILVTYSGQFNGSVSGLGFLALAALIFGQWKPLGILGATLFFGLAATIANQSQVIPSLLSFPPFLLKSFPYILTMLALVVFSKRTQAPRASGEIYDKGKR